jgi:hypothetical protein
MPSIKTRKRWPPLMTIGMCASFLDVGYYRVYRAVRSGRLLSTASPRGSKMKDRLISKSEAREAKERLERRGKI